MVRLMHPSSWMVCFRGCVLHQSRFKYWRSVTCKASWLDSSTSSAGDDEPCRCRGPEPGCGGCCCCSDSFGLFLSGWGMAPCEPRFLLESTGEDIRLTMKTTLQKIRVELAILGEKKENSASIPFYAQLSKPLRCVKDHSSSLPYLKWHLERDSAVNKR